MIAKPDIDMDFPLATAGDIAVINLESARQQSWSRFWQSPQREGIAEYIVEQEQMTLQFLSDASALDRLGDLVKQLVHQEVDATRTSLIQAQVASTTHRFAEARGHLSAVEVHRTLPEAAVRLLLSIDQACGNRLEEVLEIRRRMAAKSGRLEDLVPLGALLADIREFDQADRVYQQALREYQDVSPFALAWVCFQLGSLWGELVTEPQPDRAAQWYRKAIAYVPSYVKARVHLSEIYLGYGRAQDAKALLVSSVSSGDPEVHWRLADVMVEMGNLSDGEPQMRAARSGFEALLEKHLLAFADHGAEFYSGSGNDIERAFELARVNVENRPTLRAFEQAYETAIEAGKSDAATAILTAAEKRWGRTHGFKLSTLAGSPDRPSPNYSSEASDCQTVNQGQIGATT
jgi:tetratricopeptide (TPR) repeat protein